MWQIPGTPVACPLRCATWGLTGRRCQSAYAIRGHQREGCRGPFLCTTTDVDGQGTSVGLKWYIDYNDNNPNTLSFQLNPTPSGTAYLWNNAASLYGTAKYAPYYGLKEYNVSLTGRAKFIKLEMSALTSGYSAALQDMTLLYKQGKIR